MGCCGYPVSHRCHGIAWVPPLHTPQCHPPVSPLIPTMTHSSGDTFNAQAVPGQRAGCSPPSIGVAVPPKTGV